MERIRIGILGLGFGRHITRQIAEGEGSPYCELAAVCDLQEERCQEQAAHYGVPGYRDFADLLADESIPAVGIFTGPVGRAQLIRRALDAGKFVMTTKPFERDSEAALTLLRDVRAKGQVVHLNSPAPVLPAELQALREWEELYDLGRPVAVRRDVWVSYHEELSGTWLDDPAQCPVAPVFRLGIYLINDLVRLHGEAETVTVLQHRLRTPRPAGDNGQLGIKFRNGFLANIFASFCVLDGQHYRNTMVLNYERGTVYLNAGPTEVPDDEGQIDREASRLALVQAHDNAGRVVAHLEVAEGSGAYQWENFAKACRGEKLPSTVTPEEVCAGLRVIEAMYEASQGTGVASVRPVG